MTGERSQRICAIRLPGTSRARFADAGDLTVELGDWATIDTGAGEEAGRIVVAADQWLSPVSMSNVPSLIRTLEESDLDIVAASIERARALLSPAAQVFRESAPGVFLCGLRFTLAGDRAIVAWIGDASFNASELETRLASALETSVVLEQDQTGRFEDILLGGSVGAPRATRPETFRELLQRRFDVLRTPGVAAPHGMPRLGSTVATADQLGTLTSVDIRRGKATVELGSGEEIIVGIDELREPSGSGLHERDLESDG